MGSESTLVQISATEMTQANEQVTRPSVLNQDPCLSCKSPILLSSNQGPCLSSCDEGIRDQAEAGQ